MCLFETRLDMLALDKAFRSLLGVKLEVLERVGAREGFEVFVLNRA